MKDIRLILCDIDGTLAVTGQPLSDRTRDVLNRLHDHGIMIGIASGRSVPQQLKYVAKRWNLDWEFDLLIGMNGCEMWDEHKQAFSNHMLLKKVWRLPM